MKGVIGTVKNHFIGTKEACELLGIKEAKARAIINSLRDELITQKKLTPEYPRGKCPKKYFMQRCMIE